MKQDYKSALIGQQLEVPEARKPSIRLWRPFPVTALPEPLHALVSSTSRAIGCDPSMVALPALAACASAIGTTRQARLKNSWAEPCVLWLVVVARSGTLKSPALDHALAHLRQLQRKQFKAHGERVQAHELKKLQHEAALADWRKSKDRGEPPEKPKEPKLVRLIVADCTVEALAPILVDNPRGLLLERDELSGWFAGFDQYKSAKGADVANWLEMHRAGPITVDRKTGVRIIHVPRAAVSVCGTIQPDTLRRQLTPEFFDCGLAARLLLAMPPINKKRWRETDVSQQTVDRFANSVERLLTLQQRTDDDDEPVPHDVHLSADANRLWVAWFAECADSLDQAPDDRTAAVLAKVEGYAARLALVCQLVREPDSTAIDAEAMQAGIELARWFAQEAERIYQSWSETSEERECRELVELIERKGGVVAPRDLMRYSRRFPTAEDAETALNRLAQAGDGAWDPVDTEGRRGRPARRFRLASRVDADTNSVLPGENGIVSTSTPSTACPGAILETDDEVVEWVG